MSFYKVTGEVYEIGQPKKFSEKFSAQELVVEKTITKQNGDTFTKYACFQFANQKMEKLNGLRVGDAVEIEFDVTSRKPSDRWFSSLDGWNVNILQGAASPPTYQAPPAQSRPAQSPVMDAEDDQSLPF
jgi:hypothetical protein